MEVKNKHQNSLLLYRRRMGFSQKHVARLLGHPNTGMLSRYERGRSLPPLLTGLRLEIIYRVPVAFLYGERYEQLRELVRQDEENLRVPSHAQGVLF
jgi:transcriptional regulator with XRE-family HTH domain